MKKTLAILLILVICILLVACGKEESNLRTEIEHTISAHATLMCLVESNGARYAQVDTLFYVENEDGVYDCKGYISIIGDYGDQYRVKYDAIVKVQDGEGSIVYFTTNTPIR